jgi:hypothetical protein
MQKYDENNQQPTVLQQQQSIVRVLSADDKIIFV